MRAFTVIPVRLSYDRVPRDAPSFSLGVRWELCVRSAPRDCTYTLYGHRDPVKGVATNLQRMVCPVIASAAAGGDSRMNGSVGPSRRAAAAWTVNGLGNTPLLAKHDLELFSGLGGCRHGWQRRPDRRLNTIVMSLMLAIGPWLGAMSDRLPRRLPLLMATTAGYCGLTFFVGSVDLQTSLLLFLFANLLFQAGIVIYDALLPTIATPETRGRVGGTAVGVGSLGALLGIGIGNAVLRSGDQYATIFRFTAVAVLALALPCFIVVKEPVRSVALLTPLSVAHRAWQDVMATARRSRSYPQVVRFLIGRACYSQAANTIGLFLGVYLTVR